ncbi:sensor histidine kinase [Streptomyces caniscabiei]|uniref:histidine kinase n=1 Tax=Streptomyces caniscabiei TaxID=2746961 RepID=A0A927QET8_9ACTN|nr:ATP-binding protein [Streptomyces caniscabiei]MBD9724303.1 hypothetical protein [Streptomyces caniscabiei]MDX3513293.1 hypothetical protein [Streptomyces caniscabiei]MDX3718794.1 hypothetical protein [Streptomyces caniscabiei]WEO21819.1 hypothetical protein IHE65_00960 [Streptomyces caniscabiei]
MATRVSSGSRTRLRPAGATLGVLRQVDETAPIAPTAGLDRLDGLVAATRLAGLDVRVQRSGEREQLPTEVDLAAYRIVQESLTNVNRHSHATAVTIGIQRGAREVTVEITDNGHGPAAADGRMPGSGIRGMRERAHLLGGELTVGPGPEGGFTVRGRIPCTNGARYLP